MDEGSGPPRDNDRVSWSDMGQVAPSDSNPREAQVFVARPPLSLVVMLRNVT